jgi:hypothetical protein
MLEVEYTDVGPQSDSYHCVGEIVKAERIGCAPYRPFKFCQ